VLVGLNPLSSKVQQCSAKKLENKWFFPLNIAKFLSDVAV
jgi:hypothetical protein